jgi:hypothetical protein
MGLGSSAPVDFPLHSVIAVTDSVLSLFIPLFIKAFGISLVDVALGVKRITDPVGIPGDEALLLKPPIATVPLRAGYIRKLGGKRQNWKRRWEGCGPARARTAAVVR